MPLYDKEKTLEYLDAKNIRYEKLEHDPVYTMEEMDAAGITQRGNVCKNLFLRDAKGKKHYLVVVPEDKHPRMDFLAEKIGSTKLSFASAERLEKYLGVAQGSVSPLGILNDENCDVTVCFESGVKTMSDIGVHPNENTATIWMDFSDLENLIKEHGNRICFFSAE